MVDDSSFGNAPNRLNVQSLQPGTGKNSLTTLGMLITHMEFKELFQQFPQSGVVEYLSFRKKRAEPVEEVNLIVAIANRGLEGDRYKNAGGARQVTLIQGEHIDTIAAFLRKERIDPSMLRRNIVVRGINLLALKGKQFNVGDAVLEHSGDCHPCSRMEQTLGTGGYNAIEGSRNYRPG